MDSSDSIEQIRRRMAELRRELTVDVREVGRSARAMTDKMTDWTFYVRRFPWATAAVAAGIGYLLIPKKKQVISPDPETLAKLVKNREMWVETAAHKSETRGVAKSLLVTAAGFAARAALNHLVQKLQTPKQDPMHESPPPAPSPLEEPWKN